MPVSSFSASPQSRLSQISAHMASTVPTAFHADVVPQAPEDPLFGLMAAFRKDTFENKVDLGIGAYRDNNAKPWVLPVVKKVCRPFMSLQKLNSSNDLHCQLPMLTEIF